MRRLIHILEEEVEWLLEPVAVYEQASQKIDFAVINVEIRDFVEFGTLEYL